MNLNELIGIGLRHPHYTQVIEELPPVGWFEVHSENFMGQGGPPINILTTIRKNYPISLHGVGLSLGSSSGVSLNHLAKLKKLINLVDPFLVSEHLSWGYIDGVYMPDLLAIPYTKESLKLFAQNIDQAQNLLQKEILLENPSSYLEYTSSNIEEADFLITLCQITGAKILLDINNIFVSCSNHGWDIKSYIDKIPAGLVKEIHLAGHSTKVIAPNQLIRIDTHDDIVCPEVWDLYKYTIQKFGPVPTLIEWDAKIPEINVLIQEGSKALTLLKGCYD